jgi:hypothetical protein
VELEKVKLELLEQINLLEQIELEKIKLEQLEQMELEQLE